VVFLFVFVRAGFDWLTSNFCCEFARGCLLNRDMETWLELFPNQDSAVLTSTGRHILQKGDRVAFYLF